MIWFSRKGRASSTFFRLMNSILPQARNRQSTARRRKPSVHRISRSSSGLAPAYEPSFS